MATDDAAETARRALADTERALRELAHDFRALHWRVVELERDRDALRAAFRALEFAGREARGATNPP